MNKSNISTFKLRNPVFVIVLLLVGVMAVGGYMYVNKSVVFKNKKQAEVSKSHADDLYVREQKGTNISDTVVPTQNKVTPTDVVANSKTNEFKKVITPTSLPLKQVLLDIYNWDHQKVEKLSMWYPINVKVTQVEDNATCGSVEPGCIPHYTSGLKFIYNHKELYIGTHFALDAVTVDIKDLQKCARVDDNIVLVTHDCYSQLPKNSFVFAKTDNKVCFKAGHAKGCMALLGGDQKRSYAVIVPGDANANVDVVASGLSLDNKPLSQNDTSTFASIIKSIELVK